MTTLDTPTLAQRVVKLGLVTPQQLQECQRNLASTSGEPEVLLRELERKGYLTSLQSDKLLRGDTDGYFLGGYRLLYKIASGSFGRVFRGDDPQSGRVVAIKVLRRRWSDDPQAVELFEREGRVGMSLQHPNIVEILRIGRDPATRQYFFVMDFVEGGNLRDLLKIRGKFEPAEALRLMEDMASALAYAFSKGVTHRDIKLTNILISSQGAAKLVDFGLAQIYASARKGNIGFREKEEDEVHVQRTVDYAGLEKATDVKSGDVRSDIFFLGCVLYEMLTGRPPLSMPRDKHQRMMKSRFENIPPMKPEEVKAPASIFRLVETMMSLDPLRRYQTPAQLLDAIRHVRADIAGADGRVSGFKPPAPTVFVIEKDERLQDAIRDKLKKDGYRVLMAGDPARAVERYYHHPFAALIVDAGTAGDPSLTAFKEIRYRAEQRNQNLVAILILNEEQQELAFSIPPSPTTVILVRPLKMGALSERLHKLVPVEKSGSPS